MIPLEEIRDASEEALAKINNDHSRIHELNDDDLCAVALQVKVARPLMEQTLVAFCNGDVDKANDALARVATFKQARLVRLVRAGHTAMKTHRNPSLFQLAALVYDVTAGVGAVCVEQERRQATRGHGMN